MKLDATVDGKLSQVEVRLDDGRYSVELDGRRFDVDFLDQGSGFASLLIDGRSYCVGLERRAEGFGVFFPEGTVDVVLADAALGGGAGVNKAASGPARIAAPMPGRLIRILVEPGDEVASGQGLVVIEAMKMENELRAPRAGKVKQIAVEQGQAVEAGALLVVVE